MKKAINIGITIGDPSGIGPEVVVKSLQRLAPLKGIKPYIFGDKTVLTASGLRKHRNGFEIIDPAIIKSPEIKFGVLSKKFGYASLEYLKNAVYFLKQGIIDCLVTAPVNKKAVRLTRASFIGHTEFLAQCFRVKRIAMMFIARELRVGVVTRHIALTRVASSLTKENILQTIEVTHEALRNDFKIRRPKIAILGLNPHASDGGAIGFEENTIIAPAIRRAKKLIKKKACITGPLPPDSVFHRVVAKEFDAVICMYHDQALIPFKLLHFFHGVNMTAGLPFVRTSCDHGTAFEIAGKNKANFHSMLNAIKLACTLTKNKLHH